MLITDFGVRLRVISFGRHRGRFRGAIAHVVKSPCAQVVRDNSSGSLINHYDSNTESKLIICESNPHPSSTICTSMDSTPLETNLREHTGSGNGGAVPLACVSPLSLLFEGSRQMYGLTRGIDPPSPQHAFVEAWPCFASQNNKQGLRSNRHTLFGKP